MEITQTFKSVPKPTLQLLRPGDAFVVEEKKLHDYERVAYMRIDSPYVETNHIAVVRLTDGKYSAMRETVQVLPVKAVLTLEVPFG